MPTVFKWAVVAGSLLVMVAMIEAVRRHGRRDRQVRQAALAAGLGYDETDPANIHQIRFQAFSYAKRLAVSNVVTTKDSVSVARAFDYNSYDEVKRRGRRGAGAFAMGGSLGMALDFAAGDDGLALDDERTTRVFGSGRTGAFVKLEAYLPPMSVMQANLFTRVVEGVADDIDFESDEFNRAYDVRCSDKRFAWLFLDAQMIDFILGFDGRFGFETFGNYVLCYGKRAEPTALPELARKMLTLPSIVNPLVYAEYPTTDGLETRDALATWQARPNGSRGYF